MSSDWFNLPVCVRHFNVIRVNDIWQCRLSWGLKYSNSYFLFKGNTEFRRHYSTPLLPSFNWPPSKEKTRRSSWIWLVLKPQTNRPHCKERGALETSASLNRSRAVKPTNHFQHIFKHFALSTRQSFKHAPRTRADCSFWSTQTAKTEECGPAGFPGFGCTVGDVSSALMALLFCESFSF